MSWPAFSNPLMLAALAAAGLPVLVHLLTRARPRAVAFPPFRFLVEACAGQQSVHRLRTIVLLALRCLAMAALALLFARPFLKPAGAAAGAQASQRVVIVLDASLSMRAVQRGVTLFSRAKAEAADVLRNLEPGSEAAVVLMGRTARPLLPALSRNLPALHDALVAAAPTYEQGDPAAALAQARQLLGESPGAVCVFSDFQKSNWEALKELPAGLVCRLRPVAEQPVWNAGLVSARLVPAEPVAGEPVQVVCGVFNSSPQAREETVRLELAGTTQEARVTVQPFGSADAVFNVSFPEAGVFAGAAALPADDLTEDNKRYLAARVHKALNILVMSDASVTDARSAAFFVMRGLVPSTQAAPGFALTRRHSQDTDRGVLETSDAYVIVAPAALSGEAGEIITRRVNEGAQLLVFLDGPSAAALAPPALRPPFQLLQAVSSAAGDSLVAGPGRLFGEADAADWSSIRLHRHWLAPLAPGRENEMLLAYPDGSAAVTLTPAGKGSVVFANLALTPDGGDLIGHPVFPAMLHELLRSVRQSAGERAVTPGEAWTLDALTGSESAVSLLDPDNQPVESKVLSSGRTTRFALPTASKPGAYLARQDGRVAGAGVVNVDPRESDTRPLAVESLKPGQGSSVSVLRGDEDLLLAGQARPLWPHLAAAALVFFGCEMLLLAVWRRPLTVRAALPETEEVRR